MKTPIQVDRPKLELAVQLAESKGALSNHNVLWETAASLYNAMDGIPREISFSVVRSRVLEWKLPIVTVAGKRGRAAGVPMTADHKAKLHGGKKKGNKVKRHPQRDASLAAMRAELVRNDAERFLPLVELVGQGSRRAKDKLFCLGCVGYQSAEVRRCSDIGCPHWLSRPFQKSAEDASAEEMEAEDVVELEELSEVA